MASIRGILNIQSLNELTSENTIRARTSVNRTPESSTNSIPARDRSTEMTSGHTLGRGDGRAHRRSSVFHAPGSSRSGRSQCHYKL